MQDSKFFSKVLPPHFWPRDALLGRLCLQPEEQPCFELGFLQCGHFFITTTERDPPPPHKVTCSLVKNVEQALQSLCRLPHDTELNSWLDGTPGSFIALTNGIVDIDRAAAGQPNCLLSHTPDWFSLVVLPYPFDASATCPTWLAFLAKNLEGDAERIAILQEWFGLCLINDTSFQKFLLMQGEGANGKSVACAVLNALLGADNVSNVPLEGFGERFQLMQTVGKLANIAAEVGEIDKVAEGHLKAFTAAHTPLEKILRPFFSCTIQ